MKINSLTGNDIELIEQTVRWAIFIAHFDNIYHKNNKMSLEEFWKTYADDNEKYDIASYGANIAFFTMLLTFAVKANLGTDNLVIFSKDDPKIEIIKENQKITDRYLIKKIRNALAHGRFEWENGKLSFDDGMKNQVDFKCSFSSMKNLTDISIKLLNEIRNSKQHKRYEI